MILQNKNAVVYGAGGSLGGAVAKALAGAGARVFLTGHLLPSVQKVANEILAARGTVEVDEVDAFDEDAIRAHLERVVQKAGKIDISFNAAGVDVIQNVPLTDIAPDDFVRPVTLTMQTRFLTAIAAGKVVTIRSGGSPDSKVFKDAIDSNPAGMEPIIQMMKADTMLKQMPLMADIANAAVFLASDMAGKITGVIVDVTAGTTAGLNYKVQSTEEHYPTFGQKK